MLREIRSQLLKADEERVRFENELVVDRDNLVPELNSLETK